MVQQMVQQNRFLISSNTFGLRLRSQLPIVSYVSDIVYFFAPFTTFHDGFYFPLCSSTLLHVELAGNGWMDGKDGKDGMDAYPPFYFRFSFSTFSLLRVVLLPLHYITFVLM
ncbi:hypothetical protein OCU04_000744 [Sclerotinia nivalis]|uniref:Transmembrane protein n=1 Tax=Sclerotinia nivalis TaxID=352851 RepID=A0A9X0DNQ4_9HELO|nr:hypothetical protein OCU04_000744 [Sclerotinia nivalis]